MKNFQVKNNKLIINNKLITFDYDIEKIINNDDKLYILLSIPIKKIYNNNIFAVSQNGDMLWQVELPWYAVENKDYPFTNIWFNEEETKLYAYNWHGFEHIIDIKTGEIDDGEFTK